MSRTHSRLTLALLASTAISGLPQAGTAGELPTGGSVAYGNVGISSAGANALAIRQVSPVGIVNWQTFSIGQGARVDITQPSASSTLLNRVGSSATSTIAGQLNANGQVYLVNPNGIVITPTGSVKAGGFVASTLGITDDDFRSGRRTFSGSGNSASVVNQGRIEIGSGGYAALLGGKVENSGVISVPMGRVGLGAGEQATLDLSGDGFLQVAVPSKGLNTDGALITQSGRISARGGRVEIQAATARDAARQAINMSGIVEARSVSGRSGAIVLGGGMGGRVTVSGRLDASATTRTSRRASGAQLAKAPSRGGSIVVTGDDVRLAGATLDASGPAGGGTVRVGGDLKGDGPLQRASTTSVDSASLIKADATVAGDGGSVVVWSDVKTGFEGRITARGGPNGGDGGSAEVSGKSLLAYEGLADLTAAKGRWGTLLLDPYNVTISNAADANQSSFAASGNNSVINANTLQTALRSANVTVTTGGAETGAQAGDITVAAPLTWGAGNGRSATTLTLSAFRSIGVGANLTVIGNGGLALNTNQGGTGGTLTFAPGASASFTGATGGQTLGINNQPYTLVRGVELAAFLSNASSAGGNYALANDLAAAGLTRPINTAPNGSNVDFTGSLNGLGHTVSGLTLTSSNQYVGLFGLVRNATIANLNLTNVNVRGTYAGEGTSYVGGLVGQAINTTISDVNVSGAVTNASTSGSSAYTGGLAGSLSGLVQRSLAQVAVTGGNAGSTATGGLLGLNAGGTVSQASATGAVTAGNAASGDSNTGGLIGQNQGNVTQSFATNAVAGGTSNSFSNTGGLVGYNNAGTVTQSYATGVVTGGSATESEAGGLIGYNSGTVTLAYASGSVTGNSAGGVSSDTGGLIGFNPNGIVADAYATGAVSGGAASSNSSFTGGLIGYSGTSSITRTYATGRVTGGNAPNALTGGLVGRSSGIQAAASFFDNQTTGQAQAAGDSTNLSGATGLTTAQFQNPNVFIPLASGQGWNFQTTWAPPSAGFYPQLYSVNPVIYVAGRDTSREVGLPNPVLTGSVFGGPGVYVFDASSATPDAGSLLTTSATQASGAGAYAITPVSPFTSQQGTSYRVTSTGTLTVTSAASQQPTLGIAQARDIAAAQPTLSRQLGNLFTPVTNSTNSIELGGGSGSGGGPTLGTGQGSSTSQSATRSLAAVQRFSSDLNRRIAACEGRGLSREAYTGCVGSALDEFANNLDSRILELPPPLRNVTAVIREAARNIRASRSVAEASASVRAAVAEVRKAIALIRADEPAVSRLQVRQGNAIASALQSVDNRLARAVGL